MSGLLKIGLGLYGFPQETIDAIVSALPAVQRIDEAALEIEPLWEKMLPLVNEARPVFDKVFPDIKSVLPVAEQVLKYINSKGT